MGATRRAADTIARAAGLASDGDFATEVMAAVASVLPHDGYCLFGVDPASRIRTFMLSRHGLDGVAARLTHNETVERDVNRYSDLAAAAMPAGLLGGNGSRDVPSPRLNEILRPAGVRSELRLGLGTPSTWWGGLSLFRAGRRRPFAPPDVQVAADIAGALSQAVRCRPLRSMPSNPAMLPPGVVLLDPSDNVVSMTTEARAWLEDLCAGGSDETTVEDVMRVLY